MDKTVIIISFVLLILFVFYTINSSTLHNINAECNKDLIESKKYKFAYYGSGLFAFSILAFASYTGYNYSKGNKIFNENFGNVDIIKTLELDPNIKHHIVSN